MTAPTIDDDTADTVAANPDSDVPVVPTGWRGLLLPVNTISGDYRMMTLPDTGPDATVPQRPLPLPLSAQLMLEDGHDGSVVVGLITRLWLDTGGVWGEGTFDLVDPVAADWAARVGRGVAGWVSADLSDIEASEVPLDADGNEIPLADLTDPDQGTPPPPVGNWLWKVTNWKMMGATLVSSPAFEQARISPVYDFTADLDNDQAADEPVHTGAMIALIPAEEDAQRLAVPGGDAADEMHCTLAYLGNAVDWSPDDRDAVTAAVRNLGWTGSLMGNVWGHASFNPNDAEKQQCAVYLANGDGLPELHAAATQLAGGCGPGIPPQHSPFVPHITAGYDMDVADLAYTGPVRFDRLRVAFGGTDVRDIPLDGTTAALTAAAITYDAADFLRPEADELTAITITDDGEVYGHLAAWDSCHLGYSECVSPTPSGYNYAYFHNGEVATNQGRLPVGKITLGTGHASLVAGARAATEHYDNTGTAVAIVRCRDGAIGPWLSGRILPGVGEDRVDELRRSGISGDWRGIRPGDRAPELVAVLAVNVPGYPIPRTRVLVASGHRTLIASTQPRPAPNTSRQRPVPGARAAVGCFDKNEFRAAVVHEIRAEHARAQRVAAAAARVRCYRAAMVTARMRTHRVAIARRRATAAAGVDVDPVDDRQAKPLERYWTEGKGLARWADEPHPYRALVKALTEEAGDQMTPAEIKGLAAEYYHKVFGKWPGKHGHPKKNDEDEVGEDTEAAAAIRRARLTAAIERMRTVRTPAGEKRYGVPIGSPIPTGGKKRAKKSVDDAVGEADKPVKDGSSFKGKSMSDLLDDADKAAAARDHDTIEKILAEVDRRETANAQARERRAKAKTAKQAAQDKAFGELVAKGVDEESAVEQAYGVPVEKQRRIQATATLRNWGYQGNGLDELVKAWHNDEAERAYLKAEDATRGHMVKPKYEGKIAYRDLWNVNDATARKYASDELLQWWDEHGRVTPAILKASVLDPARFDKLMSARKDYLR